MAADPTIRIDISGAPSVSEGDSGTTPVTFTVSLSDRNGTRTAASSVVTVNYATVSFSFEAVAGNDFTSVSGTLTFAIGETSKTVTVSVIGDTVWEPGGRFGVRLSGATGTSVEIGNSVGTCGIINDDPRPQALFHSFFAVQGLETPYVGDFNGDGKADIITFTRQNPSAVGDVYVSLSTGTSFGTSTKWHDWFAINSNEQVVIGDYDGDGKDDIATWLATSTRQVYVARSLGTGMTPELVWVNSIGTSATDILLAGDANGDGKKDLILFARSEGRVYVALSNGSSFGPPTIWHNFFAVSTRERPRVADVDGDGKADIITFATDSPTAFGDVFVALSTGSQFGDKQNSAKWHDFFAISSREQIRFGDLNADGKSDFFTFLPWPQFGQCYTSLSQGTAMGENVLWKAGVEEKVDLLSADEPFVGDVNGDGKADIIIFARSEGKVYVSLAP